MGNRTVTAKVKDLLSMGPALRGLGALGIKASTSFVVSRIARIVQTEIDAFTEQRNALIEKLGVPSTEPDARKKKVIMAPSKGGDAEKYGQFMDEMEELSDREVELTVPTLRVDDLTNRKKEEADVEPNILLNMGDLILPPKEKKSDKDGEKGVPVDM